MKKLLTLLLLGIFLVSFASALQIDNVKIDTKYNPSLKQAYTIGDKQVDYNKLWDTYEPIRIDNTFGLGKKLFEAALVEHSESCGTNCFSQMTIYTSGDDAVIDSTTFKTLQEDDSWINQPIRSYQWYVKTGGQMIDVDDYEYQCTPTGRSANGTQLQDCQNVLVGSHQEESPEWTSLAEGEVLPEGTYTIKLGGEKKASRTVDWVIETNGKVLSEWAVWIGNTDSIITDYTNITGWTSSTNSNWYGLRIHIKNNLTHLYQVTKEASVTATQARLTFNNGTVIATNSFVGNIATFANNTMNEADYRIELNAGGSSYTFRLDDSSYPQNDTNVDWIKGSVDSGDDSSNPNRYYNIESIGTWTQQGTVTLNSPADASISQSTNVQFNATATVTGGATLVNMSLYTNETGSWAVRNTTYFTPVSLYDNFDDNILNTTKWTNTTSGSGGSGVVAESGQVLQVNSTSSIGSGPGTYTGGASAVTVENMDILNFTINNIKNTGSYSNGSGGTPWVYREGYNRVTVGSNVIIDNWEGNKQGASAPSYTYTAIYNDLSAGKWELLKNDSNNWNLYKDDIYVRSFSGLSGKLNFLTDTRAGNGYSSGGNSIQETSIILDNVYYNNLTSSTKTFNRTITDLTLWNVQACDSDGDCGFATSNYTVSVDATAPSVTIDYPTGTISGLINGQTVDLNTTITDSNLDSCWYDYNSVNTTIPSCTDYNFTYVSGVNTITVYANDSVGNLGSDTSSWSVPFTINNEWHNTSSAETASEKFTINIDANSSLTSVLLNYSGTNYATTNTSGNWSKTIDIPTGVQNTSYNYILTYVGTNYSSGTYYQNVVETTFALCNATYTVPFVNYTFKDESDLSSIDAVIQSSSFDYYLGSGTVTKNLLYSTASANYNYTFCATPTNRTLNVDPTITYLNTSYPQRTYDPTATTLTSSTTNQTLYLLSSTDGIYVTFLVATTSNTPVTGATVTILREISGSNVTVAQGTTDSSGAFTAWLNPNYDHIITASKTGFGTTTVIVKPTQSTYTITLSSELSNYTYVSDYEGLKWYAFPGVGILNQSTPTYYGFNITAENSNLLACKIEILNEQKTIVLNSAETNTTNGSNCFVQVQHTVNSTYPQIKGRLLVDLGDGYQLLEDDAYWAYLPFTGSGLTFTDWFNGLKELDLSYFNNDVQHREYTQILLFFLVVMIILATLNFVAGWDIQTRGGMIYLMGTFIWIASIPGFLTLNYISPFSWMDQYFVAGIYSALMIGFGARSFR